MSSNKRYSRGGGGGGRGDSHNRSSVANYASVVNGNNNDNSQSSRPSSGNGRRDNVANYPNSNYVVTHRVEQQYSVQVINPADQQQQHRQHGSNVVSVAPIPKIPHPSTHVPVESIPPNSLAAAVVPYAEGGSSRNSNTNIPVSSPTASSTPPQPEVEEDEDILELEEGGFHYKKLGEMLGTIYLKSNHHLKTLRYMRKMNKKLIAEKDVLEKQLGSLQQEKETQTKRYEMTIQFEQNETTKITQECMKWRDQAIQLNGQLDSANIILQDKLRVIDSHRNEITSLKAEYEKHTNRIKHLEQNEKDLQSKIETINQTIEHQNREIQRKCDELGKAESRCKDMQREFKQLDDETVIMKKELNKKIISEQKKVQDLEITVIDWHAKYKTLREACDKYKSENKRLESSRDQLELKIKGLNESLGRKESELISTSEERDSLQIKMQAHETMLHQQNAQIQQIKSDNELLKKHNSDLQKEVNEERELKKRILDEQMELYTKPTLLNQLMQQKIQMQTLLATPPSGLLQIKSSSECTSPVASEEIPEPQQYEEENETSSSNGDSGNMGHRETMLSLDTSRKRKYPASSTTDGRNKNVRICPDPVSSTNSSAESATDTQETEGDYATEHCKSCLRRLSSNNADNENDLTTATHYRSTGGNQNKIVTSDPDTTIRIHFTKPSINVRKSK